MSERRKLRWWQVVALLVLVLPLVGCTTIALLLQFSPKRPPAATSEQTAELRAVYETHLRERQKAFATGDTKELALVTDGYELKRIKKS